MTLRRLGFPSLRLFALVTGCATALLGQAAADPIRNPTAIFAGLDKTTGRIINFEVAIDETVQFGFLQVTPRVCNTRPQTEAPQTTSFVEVDELEPGKNDAKRIFSGWMFAASPGLHGVEHPVYDVWLTDCKGGREIVQAPADNGAGVPAAPPSEKKRSRSRKVEPVTPTPVEAAPIGPRDAVAPEQNGRVQGERDNGAAPSAPAEKPKKKKKKTEQPSAPRPAANTAPPFPF